MSTYGCARWFSDVAICRYFQMPSTGARRKIRPAAKTVTTVSIPNPMAVAPFMCSFQQARRRSR
jgi:hypothetical protein